MKIHFLFFLFSCFVLSAQSQVKDSLQKSKIQHINSDKIEVKQDLYDGNQLFTGNVKFLHDGTYLESDSVVFYKEEDYFKAFSNAVIYNDSLRISANELDYDSNTRTAKAKENARLIDKEKTLTSDYMEYNRFTEVAAAAGNVLYRDGESTLLSNKMEYRRKLNQMQALGNVVFSDSKQNLKTSQLLYNKNTKIASYGSGAVIRTNDGSLVESKRGNYNVETKNNTLTGDVYIENRDYFVNSKRADYDSQQNRLVFTGETIITSKQNPNNYIETPKGIYYNLKKEAYLEQRSEIHYNNKILFGDKIYYNQITGFGKANGNVIVRDTIAKSTIYGDYGEIYSRKDSVFITKNAYAAKDFGGDSLYIHAQKLVAKKRIDSSSVIQAYNKVSVYKSNVQAKCDSLSYEDKKGELSFYTDPIMWVNKTQITGDTIRFYTNAVTNKLDSAYIYRNGFVASRVDSTKDIGFHQISSKFLKAYMRDGKMNKMKAEINANAINYVIDEGENNLLVGINQSKCGLIEVDFLESEINLIACSIGANSVLYPPSKIEEKDRKLLGFSWREEERPKSKADIFPKPPSG